MTARSYYDTGSLHIESYDSIYDPLPSSLAGDVAFYADLARASGQPVLEIGCGTGRVALALAASGIEVTGLDLSSEMLAAARAKLASLPPAAQARLQLVVGDMRTFTLRRSFGTVLVPFRTFHLLLTETDQQHCLAAIARHLVPGGRLALHLFDPPPDIAQRDDDVLATERGVSADTRQRVVAHSDRCTIDAARQVRRETWHYRELDAAGTTLRAQDLELAVRWIWPQQAETLLTRAGFVVEARYSDFARRPPRRGGEQIWIARKV